MLNKKYTIMRIGYVTHEESAIQHFMDEPEFADYLMNEVIQDGDKEEIAYFQKLYDEARARLAMPKAVNA